jgi:hypothetical protein
MQATQDTAFYTSRQTKLLEQFDEQAVQWRHHLTARFNEAFAQGVIRLARDRFTDLLATLPYIGGDGSHLTANLLDAARCLALYLAMRSRGKSAAQTGKVLYDAILSRGQEAYDQRASVEWLSEDELMQRRLRRAERSQRRAYADDWVYEFVPGDGGTFDYGYDFVECAAQKLFHQHGADEFLAFYCFLDFAASKVLGLGLTRSKTLASGDPLCNHRFKRGSPTGCHWPPPFLRQRQSNGLG